MQKRRNQLNWLFAVALFVLCGCMVHEKEPRKTSRLSISEEISNLQVNCIGQDKKGYIWIGTSRGLNRYNGYDYLQYFNNDSIRNTVCNNNIQDIYNDREGNLWIGTNNGISKYLTKKEHFLTIPVQGTFKSVNQIQETKDGHIFANMNKAIYKYFVEKNVFVPILHFNENNQQNKFFIDAKDRLWLISKTKIDCYEQDGHVLLKSIKINHTPNLFYANFLKNGQLWTMHGKGSIKIIDTNNLTEISIPGAIKKHSILSEALVTYIFTYNDQKLLINTHKNGLFLYDKKENKIIHQSDPGFPFVTPNCQITFILKDNLENLWIGSHEQGVFTIYKYKNQFNSNRPLRFISKDKSINAIAIDYSNRLWISTYTDELLIYNLSSEKTEKKIDLTQFFREDPYFQDKIKSIITDKRNIWLLTDAKIVRCRYTNNQLIRKKTYNTKKKLLQFVQDKFGTIWCCTENNFVFIISENKDHYDTLTLFPSNRLYKSSISPLSDGKVVVAASEQPLKVINPITLEVKNIDLSKLTDIESFDPNTIFEDSQKNIWIGLNNGPLLKYNPGNNTVTKINIKNVTSIVEDANKNIWTGTLYGLSYYIVKKGVSYSYYAYDGIGGNQFNLNCTLKLPDSSLIFGGTHGLTVFQPSQISMKRIIPFYFEDIKINNVSSHSLDNPKIKYALSSGDNIVLKHNQNTISISYAALDYSEYSRLRYYYHLEGYNDQWINAKNAREAHYANLSPGDYTFKVKVTSNDNSFTESENSLHLTVSRPLWLSGFAIVIYLVIIAYLTWLILNLYSRIRMSKAKALMAIREKEHEAYMNNMNMSFFSNISHEFRTPLTIISAPISSLIKSINLSNEEKTLLQLVQRNIKRMVKLVNQLMDLSKLEADALKLEVSSLDIIHQIRSILEIYIIYAREKDINFHTEGLDESLFMLADVDKLEKILGNILSNALKYTPSKGDIKFRFNIITGEYAATLFPEIKNKTNLSYALIQIEDSGPGIPEDKLEDIFLRYYQIDRNQQAKYNWGTGIGLYFTRQLLRLHHGKIKAENSKNGGAVFSFIIPVDNTAYSENEIKILKKQDTIQLIRNKKSIPDETITPAKEQDNLKKETIMIVDDDIEISFYLNRLLSHDYHIINKYDGESAFNSLAQLNPTLIISDILMPGLNGYELCKRIKDDVSFCHIPVILLTAKTLMEEQVEGLETGANAYVTKPFEPEYLTALIKSQLKNKKLLAGILTSNTRPANIKENILSPKDKAFIDRLYELMEQEIGNSEMNITRIAERMRMSRTKFYNKIKGLTGENPNTLIKTYKLNRAAEYLKEGKYNVSEIAEMTGFVNLSHFSVSFKKQFNCNPSEYKG